MIVKEKVGVPGAHRTLAQSACLIAVPLEWYVYTSRLASGVTNTSAVTARLAFLLLVTFSMLFLPCKVVFRIIVLVTITDKCTSDT